jgi:diguanylate cyclase (GGDEF)-like protein
VRLISRNDATLVVGLIAGTVVVFQRPLRSVWDMALEVQQRYNVDLLPALTIFLGVFIFHEARKRQQAKAEAAVAAVEAAQARKRSEELERLMTFSQALANALDETTLQHVLWRYLPAFTGEREFWLLTRGLDRWRAFLRDTTVVRSKPVEELESMAERALSPDTLQEARLEGHADGETVCFPMIAGGAAVGVLGVHDGSTLNRDERKVLGGAAALVAIAARNVQLFLATRESSLRDGLTGCFNRGHCLDALDGELRRAKRKRQPLSIVMFDIDHFKMINDELGHLRGDDLLRAVGAQLIRVLRSTDVRCRYGGDEFLVILPDTPLLGAQQVAECLRREIATLAIVAGDRRFAVTASLGVAVAAMDDLGVTALIERADEALYRAKRAGRNRFCVAGDTRSALTSDPKILRPPAGTLQRA